VWGVGDTIFWRWERSVPSAAVSQSAWFPKVEYFRQNSTCIISSNVNSRDSSKVNLHCAINFRALYGANLVTLRSKIRPNEHLELHRVEGVGFRDYEWQERGNNLKGFKDVNLKAKARIWR